MCWMKGASRGHSQSPLDRTRVGRRKMGSEAGRLEDERLLETTAPGDAQPPASKCPDKTAAHIDNINRDRRSFQRRLYLMCSGVVKAILRGRHMGSTDIKAAQWAKSKGTCRAVIDFVAEQGLWATTSMVQHREDFHIKEINDTELLRKDTACAAIPYDNCDFDPLVGERQGEGPHISMAASSVTVGPDVGRLGMGFTRSRSSLGGLMLQRATDASRNLRRAVMTSAHARSSEETASTGLEAKLREVGDGL